MSMKGKQCICEKCGYGPWEVRRKDKDGKPIAPIECPRCKSRYWNEKKKG